jgi:hypothetical protein
MSRRSASSRAGTRKASSKPRSKLDKLVKRPGVIVGDPARLASVRTFDETSWRKKWEKYLK